MMRKHNKLFWAYSRISSWHLSFWVPIFHVQASRYNLTTQKIYDRWSIRFRRVATKGPHTLPTDDKSLTGSPDTQMEMPSWVIKSLETEQSGRLESPVCESANVLDFSIILLNRMQEPDRHLPQKKSSGFLRHSRQDSGTLSARHIPLPERSTTTANRRLSQLVLCAKTYCMHS